MQSAAASQNISLPNRHVAEDTSEQGAFKASEYPDVYDAVDNDRNDESPI